MKQAKGKIQSVNTHPQKRKTMKHRFTTHLTALAAVALLLFGASQAFAGGTASGTDISNSATLDYKVGLIDQTQVDSNTVIFEVDKKVDLTVTTTDVALVQVTPGATNQVLTFTVTNTGNDTQDISLTASALGNGTTDPFGGALTDTFDATAVGVFVESGANGGYQSGEDTDTYLDELTPDVAKTVYIVRNIALSQVDDDMSVYALIGEVREGGAATSLGSALTATTAGNETDGAVDILFADGNSDDDAANDAKYSDRSAFHVVTATMAATKSVDTISDGAGGSFAIPGATVTYSILVENTGSAGADSVIIIDEIPTNTTYNDFPIAGCNGTRAWSSDGGISYSGTAPSTQGEKDAITHIRCTIASIAAATDETVSFSVKID